MIKVLIADDEVLELDYLRRLFEKESEYLLVGQAENGAQAVALADRYRPDVVVMDINMPLDGLTAAKMIREQAPGTVIILNTAYDKFEYVRTAIALHLDGYLLKPASADEILSTVRECLAHRLPQEGKASDRQSVYPHKIADELLVHLRRLDSDAFDLTAQALLSFLDEKGEWDTGYKLYLGHIIFSIEQVLKQMDFSGDILRIVDCEGCLVAMESMSGMRLRAMAEEILRRVALAIRTRAPLEEDPLEAVVSYIRTHYAEPLTLQEMADRVHFSSGYFSKRFKQRYGVNVTRYITQVRVDRAVELLTGTDRPVSDIALECGFSNMSHFFRVFKEYTGTTPGAIRKNASGE